MNLGGTWNNNPISNEDLKMAERAVFAAIESGINRFDHADIYCRGKSEEVFGKILKNNSQLRSKIKLQSKAGIELHKATKGSNRYNFSKDYIIGCIENSLRKLNTEYLDCFLFHRPDPLFTLEELVNTMDILYRSGKIHSFGVSNMSPSMVKFINSNGKYLISANQIQFSLNHCGLLNEMIEYNNDSYSDSSIFINSHILSYEIQAWSPLDKGLYMTLDPAHDQDSKIYNTTLMINELSEKYDSNPSAILLAWIFKLPYPITPVIGTTKPERIKDCTDALRVDLSQEDWYNLWISARGKKLK